MSEKKGVFHRCEYCGVKTSRDKTIFGKNHYYCSIGCEIEKNKWVLLFPSGVIVIVLALFLESINSGIFGLTIGNIGFFILGMILILLGAVYLYKANLFSKPT